MQLAWSGEAWIGQADWLEPGLPLGRGGACWLLTKP
jgi:hypothetical protein